MERRMQLTQHHTAAHIITTVCRKLFGPHIWQQGAKKSVDEAHLDLSHYQGFSKEEEAAIEAEANKVIQNAIPIDIHNMGRTEAEQKYGFRLYQGGAIPGNNLRIVEIQGLDAEACCGTHCKNTNELGIIHILKTQRISDGVVRITFVAGKRAYEEIAKKEKIVGDLCELWGVEPSMIVKTAERIFKDYKKIGNENRNINKDLLEIQIKLVSEMKNAKGGILLSQKQEPTSYFSILGKNAKILKDRKRGIVIIGNNYVIGILGDPNIFDLKNLESITKDGKLRVQNKVNIEVTHYYIVERRKKEGKT